MKPFNTNEMGTRTPKEQHRASRLIYNGLRGSGCACPAWTRNRSTHLFHGSGLKLLF